MRSEGAAAVIGVFSAGVQCRGETVLGKMVAVHRI
jgi:hypothetical protein